MSDTVSLRPVHEADLTVFYEQQDDPVANQMAAFAAREREPFLAHWHQIMADESNIQLSVLFNEELAGYIGSYVGEDGREVCYWLGRPYWGRGIATAALRQLLDLVRDRPLLAHVARHNVGSQRVLAKCGFRVLREAQGYPVQPGGQPVEEYLMVLER